LYDLSKLHEYLQLKAAGDVTWKASVKTGCLYFEFTVPGMLKSFFENVVLGECKSVAPDWEFIATEKKGDVHLKVKLSPEQTKDLLWVQSQAVSEAALGASTIAVLKALPQGTAKKLYDRWTKELKAAERKAE